MNAWQMAERMGPEADERDGQIMLDLMAKGSSGGDDEWYAMLDEVCRIRHEEDAEGDARETMSPDDEDWDQE